MPTPRTVFRPRRRLSRRSARGPLPRAARSPARWLPATLVLLSAIIGNPAFSTERPRDRAVEEAVAGATDGPEPAAAGAIDLSPYAGKVVYIDFWASWCTPCRAAFPWMNDLQAELGDEGLVVIGVNTGDTPDQAARFLAQVPVSFTLMNDDDGAIARAYGVVGMPTAFVHDRRGALVATHQGFDEALAEERAAALRKRVLSAR